MKELKQLSAALAEHADRLERAPGVPYETCVRLTNIAERMEELAHDAQVEIDGLRVQVEQLQKELTLSTDQNDLLLDEFVRVKCLTDNLEIHALCERAHLRMRQRVSVIDRNFKQAEKIRGLKSQINDLLELIYNSAEGEICMGYKADIENMAQVAHAITGINAGQLRQREVK